MDTFDTFLAKAQHCFQINNRGTNFLLTFAASIFLNALRDAQRWSFIGEGINWWKRRSWFLTLPTLEFIESLQFQREADASCGIRSQGRFCNVRCMLVCIEGAGNDSQEVWRLSEERPRTSSWFAAFQPVMHELVTYNHNIRDRIDTDFDVFIALTSPRFTWSQLFHLTLSSLCKWMG